MNSQPTVFGAGASADGKQPAFERVKAHVLAQIQAGVWREGDAIPSEDALSKSFGVSRMTVNRALRELTAEQLLVRVQGSGTFVAQHKYQATLVSLRNIADEIAARGHVHRSELFLLERATACDGLAGHFGLPAGAPLFHSVVLHLEDDLPIQWEDRYVNPAVAPDYMACDFHTQTPNAYLTRVAPLQGVSFRIEACMPPPEVRDVLRMGAQEPSLMLWRRTLSMHQVASVAKMWHPASRYQFAGSF